MRDNQRERSCEQSGRKAPVVGGGGSLVFILHISPVPGDRKRRGEESSVPPAGSAALLQRLKQKKRTMLLYRKSYRGTKCNKKSLSDKAHKPCLA